MRRDPYYHILFIFKQMINIETRTNDNLEENSAPLHSETQINPETSKQQHSEIENQAQFLDRVQDLMNGPHKRIDSKHEILLQAQIAELEKKCHYLSLTNQKLANKLNQMVQEQHQRSQNSVQNQKIDESSYLGDISEMQNEFGQMQGIIKSYREQLQSYQKLIYEEKEKYDFQLSLLKQEIMLKDQKIKSLEVEVKKTKNDLSQLALKNEQLILQIEEINQSKYKELNQSFNRLDNSYDKEFQKELENIIEKLAGELEYEHGIKKKLNEELKRMSKEVENQEQTIQRKNQIIYELQLKMLGNSKSKHIDMSWSLRNQSPKIRKIRQQKSFQSEYFNKQQYHFQNERIHRTSLNSIKQKTLLSDLSHWVLSQVQIPLFITYKIVKIYEDTEAKKLPRVKMTQKNVQVEGVNMKNISSINVVLLSTKAPRIILKNAEQYFWSTFDLIESLIISLSLENFPKVKKSIMQLGISSRNPKKLSSFVSLLSSLQESLVL